MKTLSIDQPKVRPMVLVISSETLPDVAIVRRGGKFVVLVSSTETLNVKTSCKTR